MRIRLRGTVNLKGLLRGGGGWVQVHGIGGSRLVYKEVEGVGSKGVEFLLLVIWEWFDWVQSIFVYGINQEN